MTTTEKLERIKARCQELLEIAEKRTPGEWNRWSNGRTVQVGISANPAIKPCIVGWPGFDSCGLTIFRQKQNAKFIAACAGSAEAGWRATIAAIDLVLRETSGYTPFNSWDRLASEIIAAWEGQV